MVVWLLRPRSISLGGLRSSAPGCPLAQQASESEPKRSCGSPFYRCRRISLTSRQDCSTSDKEHKLIALARDRREAPVKPLCHCTGLAGLKSMELGA